MSKQESNTQKSIVNIGTPLMVVILIGMSFAVIAALALSSGKNNYDLSNNLADHTSEYYEASNAANEKIAADGWKDEEFTIDIDENQQLVVVVSDGKITKWQVENISDWDGDTEIQVISD